MSYFGTDAYNKASAMKTHTPTHGFAKHDCSPLVVAAPERVRSKS